MKNEGRATKRKHVVCMKCKKYSSFFNLRHCQHIMNKNDNKNRYSIIKNTCPFYLEHMKENEK